MVLYERATTALDHLVQKPLTYKHEGITPAGLSINKKPAINIVSSDFHKNWKTIISKAEKDLVKLLLVAPDKIIAKIDL